MASLGTLRTNLQTRLATLQGLRVYDTHPDNLLPPCAVVTPIGADHEQTFGDGAETRYRFEVRLYMTVAGGFGNAQERMDVYLNTSSTGGVYQTVHADRTLGGVAHGAFVHGWRDYGPVTVGDSVEYLSAVVDVEVIAA